MNADMKAIFLAFSQHGFDPGYQNQSPNLWQEWPWALSGVRPEHYWMAKIEK